MLTWVGPNEAVDLSLPENKHRKPYIAKPDEKSLAGNSTRWAQGRRASLATKMAPSSTPRTPIASVEKSIGRGPTVLHVHPVNLLRQQVAEEFHELYDWIEAADAAPGKYSASQQMKRDEVGERVDLLRPFVWG